MLKQSCRRCDEVVDQASVPRLFIFDVLNQLVHDGQRWVAHLLHASPAEQIPIAKPIEKMQLSFEDGPVPADITLTQSSSIENYRVARKRLGWTTPCHFFCSILI